MNQRAKLEHQRILDPIIRALPILLPRDEHGDQLDPATYLARQVGEGSIFVLCQAGGRAS